GYSRHPQHIGLAIELAKIATRREDWPEAVTRWRKVVGTAFAEAPADAHRALSQAYRKQAHFDSAEAGLDAATELYPGDLTLAVDYAKIAGLRKRWDEAVARWLGIVEKFGDRLPAEVYVSLSKAYRMLGQFDTAEATVQGVQQKSPLLSME